MSPRSKISSTTRRLPSKEERIDLGRVLDGDKAYCDLMRLRLQTDLLFLGRALGYERLLDRVHKPVADFYVRKNPALSLEQQDVVKDRLHLDPRGTYKTTLSIVDTVQWALCFPDVAILNLSATKPLSVAVVEEATEHFVKAKDAAATAVQALFPEYCILPRERRVGSYIAPCRTKYRKEGTFMAFSAETSISGWHFDVEQDDDTVDTQNSRTAASVNEVKRNYYINHKTLNPGGYTNSKGTRYDPFDLWGDIIEKAEPGKLKILVRGALRLKDGSRLEQGIFPAPEEMELLFPELLSYEHLRKEFNTDYSSFMTQYMNDAYGGKEVTFPREAMLQATIPAEHEPVAGEMTMAVRLPCPSKNWRRVGYAVGMLHDGRMYVTDAGWCAGSPSTIAHRVVTVARKHGLAQIQIEETPGARFLQPAIENYALALGGRLQMLWTEFQDDDGLRESRIRSAEPLLTAKRLVLCAGMTSLKQVYSQFSNFGMLEENELPDVISRLAGKLPDSILRAESNPEQEAAWELARDRDQYDRQFGLGRYAAPPPEIAPAPVSRPVSMYSGDDLGGLNG